MPKIEIDLSEYEAQRFSVQLQEHAEDLKWLGGLFENISDQVNKQIDNTPSET